MEGQIKVVDKYQAPRINGQYDIKNAQLVRKGMKVPAGYVDDVNDATIGNGIFLKVDEEATQKRDEEVAKNFEAKKLKSEAKNLSAESLVDALVNAGSKAKKDEVVTLPDGEPNDTWTKPQLQLYCTENSIEFNGQLGVKKLLELINK